MNASILLLCATALLLLAVAIHQLPVRIKWTLRRLMRQLVGRGHRRATEADVVKMFGGISPAVMKLIEALKAQLPEDAMDQYERLSPGQQALTEALVYLNYQYLSKAKLICARALGDPHGPGDQWIKDFIDAIDVAIQMPDTSVEASREIRAEKARRWKAGHDFRSQQLAQLLRERDH